MKSLGSVPYLLQHISLVLQRQGDQLLQERLGLGVSQYRILLMLGEHIEDTKPVDQKSIADNLGQTEASISRQVKLLAERALIDVVTDPTERRRRLMALTPKGYRLLQAADEALNQMYEPMLMLLDEKRLTQLREALTQFHDHTCAPGKPMACDQVGDISTLYANQATL